MGHFVVVVAIIAGLHLGLLAELKRNPRQRANLATAPLWSMILASVIYAVVAASLIGWAGMIV